jgi:hypothetical protein
MGWAANAIFSEARGGHAGKNAWKISKAVEQTLTKPPPKGK